MSKELLASIRSAKRNLSSRLQSHVSPLDKDGQCLLEQWDESLDVALKYAQDPRAGACAEEHLKALLEHLKNQGITHF